MKNDARQIPGGILGDRSFATIARFGLLTLALGCEPTASGGPSAGQSGVEIGGGQSGVESFSPPPHAATHQVCPCGPADRRVVVRGELLAKEACGGGLLAAVRVAEVVAGAGRAEVQVGQVLRGSQRYCPSDDALLPGAEVVAFYVTEPPVGEPVLEPGAQGPVLAAGNQGPSLTVLPAGTPLRVIGEDVPLGVEELAILTDAEACMARFPPPELDGLGTDGLEGPSVALPLPAGSMEDLVPAAGPVPVPDDDSAGAGVPQDDETPRPCPPFETWHVDGGAG